MGIVAKVAAAVQSLVGEWAEEVAKESGVIRRKRKFSASTLARTFVFGFLAKSDASDEELAQMAGLCGVPVTPQAIEQRFTARMVTFLEGLFRRATRCVVHSQQVLAPLLERFSDVLLLDSSTITLPPALAQRFPGCGGSHGAGTAAVKYQVQWSLKSGALRAIAIEPGRDCDYKTSLQRSELPAGSLRIADLGYFDTEVLQRFSREQVYWLSRLQYGTGVFSRDGVPLRLLEWLASQGPIVDQWILLGSERKVPCRILAWRVPEEVANRRRQKLIAEARRKNGRTPSAERLAWCDWMILVTNVPAEKLSPREAAVLYRARWQIELLFKRWKSHGRVAELSGSTVERQMVRLWSRLLAVIVQHWLLLSSVWGDGRTSLAKAGTAIRRLAMLLAVSLTSLETLTEAIATLNRVLRVTARQNKRRRPSTFELLTDPSLLEYSLT